MKLKEALIAGFLAVLLIGYCLNRGVFIGSEIAQVGGYYKKRCAYLLPSGATNVYRGGWTSPEQAQGEYCRLFHDTM